MDPRRGGLRALRGGILAACSTLLGVSAHVLGDGSVALGPTLTLGVLVALVAVALAGRQRGRGPLLVVAGATQAAFHVVLGARHDTGMHHAGDTAATTSAVPGPLMLLAHAVGAVLLAVLLAHGDAALFALARAARRWTAQAPVVTDVVPARPGPGPSPLREVSAVSLLLAVGLRYRGPPVGVPA